MSQWNTTRPPESEYVVMDYRELFPVIDRHIWLNHAAISPWPLPVIQAMRAFVEDNAEYGPLHYADWMSAEANLRRIAADFFGADPDDVALLKNTSEGLSLIAAGLDWQPGDALVCCAGDFPSNLLPWCQLVPDYVEVREVPFDCADPESGLEQALDPNVRLMAVSSVRYDSGVRLNLDRLGEAVHAAGALLVVDAIQQLGALPLNVTTTPVDFVVGGSHKWLLAPEGLALFWSRPSARNQLKASQTGWRMWPDMFNFERPDWRAPASARRFEPGTLNMAGVHGLDAAIELLNSINPDDRAEQLLERTGWLIDGLEHIPGIEITTPSKPRRRAGIVCFKPGRLNPEGVLKKLAADSIFAAKRGLTVRLSPNFYTPEDQIGKALEAIKDIVARGE